MGNNRSGGQGKKRTPKSPQYRTPPNTWVPFEAQLSTREDLAKYFHHTEARLTDLNQRGLAQRQNLKSIRGEIRNMANDLGQLVTVRQRYLNKRKREKAEKGNGAVAVGQNPAMAAAVALAAGKTPVATGTPVPVQPTPPVADPHQVLYSTLPVEPSRLAINAVLLPGWVAEFLAGYPSCDEQGIIVLRNASGSATDLPTDPADIVTLTFSTVYNFQPMITAHGCNDYKALAGAAFVNPFLGGTTAAVTFQASALYGIFEPGSSFRIHYHCKKSVGG